MRTVILILATLLLSACSVYEPAGIRDLDEHAGTLMDAARVGQVLCDAPEVAVGSSMQCRALNPAGTRLSVEGWALVAWSTDSGQYLAIDLAGVVTGIAPGTARVYADGAKGSSAWSDVEVVE